MRLRIGSETGGLRIELAQAQAPTQAQRMRNGQMDEHDDDDGRVSLALSKGTNLKTLWFIKQKEAAAATMNNSSSRAQSEREREMCASEREAKKKCDRSAAQTLEKHLLLLLLPQLMNSIPFAVRCCCLACTLLRRRRASK